MLENTKTTPFYWGFVALIVEMIGSLAFCFPLQEKFRMLGLGITEFWILLCALLFIVITKSRFSDVFKFRKLTLAKTLGSALFFIGMGILTVAVNAICMLIFPTAYARAQEVSRIMSGAPLFVTLITAAVLPGICEESLHRGFILHAFRGKIKSHVCLAIISGLLFGLFHLDLVRFLTTGLLGFALAFVYLKTENFAVNVFFHFATNAFSTILSKALPSLNNAGLNNPGLPNDSYVPSGLWAAAIFMFAGISLLPIFLGKMLICEQKIKTLPTAIVVIVGFFVSTVGTFAAIPATPLAGANYRYDIETTDGETFVSGAPIEFPGTMPPLPLKAEISIEDTTNARPVYIYITDQDGKKIFEKTYTENTNETVEFPFLTGSCTYHMEIKTNGQESEFQSRFNIFIDFSDPQKLLEKLTATSENLLLCVGAK